VLLTGDKDFGELVYRLGRATAGVILLRLFGIGAVSKGEILCEVLTAHAAEMLGGFTVISPGIVRIRRHSP
jgi:predicted nuclease of predicted toxin-antitoxin system